MSASGQARPDQVPSDEGPSDQAPSAATGPRGPRRWPVIVVAVVLGVVGLLMVGYALAAQQPAPPQPPPAAGPASIPAAAPSEPTGLATLYGRVVDVTDPATVVVEVQGQRLPVGVLGVNPTIAPCATADAVAFARRTLQGQLVTLVPDPTLPPTPAPRAYVVLGSQLSYTDAALRAGWATPGDGLYRPVFDTEQRDAQKARAGMWGPPCNLPRR